MSRSSSNTSQRSARLTISPANLVPAETQVVTERGPAIQIQRGQPAHFSQLASPMPVANNASMPVSNMPATSQQQSAALVPLQSLPVPADVQLQRVNVAPIMTVSSVRLSAPVNVHHQVLPSATNKNIMSPSHPGYVNYKPPQTTAVPMPGATMVTAAVPTPYPNITPSQIATTPNINPSVTHPGYTGNYYGIAAGHNAIIPSTNQPRIASAIANAQPLQYVQPSHSVAAARPLSDHSSPASHTQSVPTPMSAQMSNPIPGSLPLGGEQFSVVVDVHAPATPTSLTVLSPTTPSPSNSVESSIYSTPVYQNSYSPAAVFLDSSAGDNDSPPSYQPPPPPTQPIVPQPVVQQPVVQQPIIQQQPLVQSVQQPIVQSTAKEVPSYQLSVPATFKPQPLPVTGFAVPVTTPSYPSATGTPSPPSYEGAKPKVTLPSYQETQPFPSSPTADSNISSSNSVASSSPTMTNGNSHSLQSPESTKQVRHNSWGQYEKVDILFQVEKVQLIPCMTIFKYAQISDVIPVLVKRFDTPTLSFIIARTECV